MEEKIISAPAAEQAAPKANAGGLLPILVFLVIYIGSGVTEKDVREVMTPPVFIHQSEKINDLLQTLQSTKAHIAIVIDEYGGTLGIVTMEDILEELVGEIWDEHDEVEEDFKELAENTYLVDCTVQLDDFSDRFDIKTESDSVSLGGWVMEQLGKIPAKGDTFEYENLIVTVADVDAHRVAFVNVVITPKKEDEEDE